MSKILIADDNKQISSILSEYVKKEGFESVFAFDGDEALEKFHEGGIDLILLDVMMPKKDGFEVCREIRKESMVPIIMVTARGEDFEKIMGLDIGADDYIVKPFSPGEVLARVRAVLRRLDSGTPKDVENIIKIDNLELNMNTYSAHIKGEEVPLTKKELEILWLFVKNPGMVFTREKLLDVVWGYDYFGDSRTVDSHIKRLRAKLDDYLHPNWEIKTIWGVGYKFEVSDVKE